MDLNESSVVARKLRNFYVTQHQQSAAARKPAPWTTKELELDDVDEKAGILRQALMVTLMGIAVALTEASLVLIRWVRKLEESA